MYVCIYVQYKKKKKKKKKSRGEIYLFTWIYLPSCMYVYMTLIQFNSIQFNSVALKFSLY